MENKKEIRKSATLMSLATVVSRFLGFGRDMISAHLFGASGISDAFVVAFRLPNFLRDLVAEGALSSAFVPGLARARHQGGDEAFWNLASFMVSAMAMALGVLVLLGLLLAPWILALAAPGFRARPRQFALALKLTRIVFPFIGFIGLSSLFMGMLNAKKSFFIPALAPAALNLAMIFCGLVVCPRMGSDPRSQIVGWAIGAVVGGALQCLVQLPKALKSGFRWKPAWPFRDAGVKRIFRTMGPAVVGQSTTQVNLLVNTILASQLAAGSVTFLYYGARVMQLPLGIFGVAIAAAVLPDLSAHHAAGDSGAYRRTLAFGLRMTMFTDLPALAGLICLAIPIHVLLFKGGHFDLADARAAAMASIAYTSGVVFMSWGKVLVPAFYALDSPSTPVKVSMCMVVVNIGLNLALWRPFGYLGLAATTSIVSLLQAVTLQVLMTRRVGNLWLREDLVQVAKMGLCTAAMTLSLAGAYWGLNRVCPNWASDPHGKLLLAVQVSGLMALGVAVYMGLSQAMGLGELIPRFWPRWAKAAPAAVQREVARANERAYDEP
ncbi:MAG: murein biosynthesis integral membrane protein MurJ [bacterium]